MSTKIMKFISLPLFLLIMTIPTYATSSKTIQWLNSKTGFFYQKTLENISPPDGLPGAVIAAKRTTTPPDYYYHWVRDAGITMTALINNYPLIKHNDKKLLLRQTFFDYLDFSTRIQNANSQASLGEPKFYINGDAYEKPWGRPQNDGPALRAISLIHWANILLDEGNRLIVRQRIYDGNLPTNTVVKKDLEYISHHWKDSSYDLWEEVKGTHFYTLMVIRRALLEGSQLATRLNDTGAAKWYVSQAKQIELELQHFWDEKNQYLLATINRVDGINYKASNLDSAVILGLLHGGMNDGFLDWDNPKVIMTIKKLINTFSNLYPINHHSIPGVAIGRYPEDRYDGDKFEGGNPWPVCTLAMAEALYRSAELMHRQGQQYEATAEMADAFVERVIFHAYQDGSMDEQIHRETGYMLSARDLTWNYAALLTTKGAALSVGSK